MQSLNSQISKQFEIFLSWVFFESVQQKFLLKTHLRVFAVENLMHDKRTECSYKHFEFDIRFNRIHKKETMNIKSFDDKFEK
jgi:hypothetical protein